MNSHARISIPFDAIPIPTFIVDDDVRIKDMNKAARVFLNEESESFRDRRGGEVLNCLRSFDVPEGCGNGPSCKSCSIRNSVQETLREGSVTRKRMAVQVKRDASFDELKLMVTASPYEKELVVLMIEDITEVSLLRELIPICMDCKKIRNGEDFWHTIESFLSTHAGIALSHGLCPSCFEKRMNDDTD